MVESDIKKDFKKVTGNKLVLAIIYVSIGFLLCIFRATMLNWLMTIVGVLMIAYGVYEIFRKKLLDGIISLAIGIVIILAGWLFVQVAMIIFGVLISIYGLLELTDALKTKKIKDIVFSSITVFLGIMLVASFWVMFDWFFICLGIIFVANGVLMLSASNKKIATKKQIVATPAKNLSKSQKKSKK